MRTPLATASWVELPEVDSTQNFMAKSLLQGEKVGVVLAHHQTQGRGRFDRQWYSERGRSLTMSIAFHDLATHPRPWLIGMAVALAAASAVRSKVAWPNDLVSGSRKIGGILTELLPNDKGEKVPVVGIGINLDVQDMPPEIQLKSENVKAINLSFPPVEELAHTIIERLEDIPDPQDWNDLRPIWSLFDATPQKHYVLTSGEEAIGIGIGPHGELICSVQGETRSVMAADAIFGTAPAS
jgi:BirA family transcriptional regulator, biotin operon repressor / biotin---[acetyl-CoA-carboxylase] ligase